MKSIDAIYKFGHLYNRETRKRILIEDGAEVSVVLQPEHILKEDPSTAQKKKPIGSSTKILELHNKYGFTIPYWLFLQAGKSLFFNISGYVPKRYGDEKFFLEFRLELLEDLFIYNKKKDRPEMARLFPCKCVILECLTDNFEFFEPVFGDSLNKARTKLHELYFSRVMNPASNAFQEFFVDRDYQNKNDSLEAIRLEVQKQPPNNKMRQEIEFN
ncbi:MAG: hypothetical protein AAF934_06850 [Bacteroidota bacterium]